MTVKSAKNQYRGINAHLHSFLQSSGEWEGFHTYHIGVLAETLTNELFDKGYFVAIESSLQIRLDSNEGFLRPRADLAIFDGHPQRATLTPYASQMTGRVVPIPMVVVKSLSEKPYRAVTIYERDDDAGRGRLVAWIELLSPSNKRRGQENDAYLNKRYTLLSQGLVYVEIDYLHHTPATYELEDVASQAPYRILVFEPRPNAEQGYVSINEFVVDQTLSAVNVPLSGKDFLAFDFAVPYELHFRRLRLGAGVDYSQLPLNFDRYSPADQARILSRMVAVCEAFQHGENLEAPVEEVTVLSIKEAIARLEAIRSNQ